MASKGSILIVDDEATAVENLAHVCRKEGYDVSTRTTGPGALELLDQQLFDLVLTDLKMDKVSGMDILRKVKTITPDTAVILITGFATFDSAVEAMKAGAFHYIAKPFRLDEIREVIKNAMETVHLKKENRDLKEQLSKLSHHSTIISQNPKILQLLGTARQIAPTDINVLITGESGTGKELFAQYIHEHSQRNQHPFKAINCGALQEDLLANELFGHEKGAFTGANDSKKGLIESSHGGTLFLDEIGEMSLSMQVKLLRVIQERELQRLGSTITIAVDIRIIAATHRDLKTEVAHGRFREDLYYRLNVINLHLPPLIQRDDDIPLLAYYFLRKHAVKMQRNVVDIDEAAMDLLQGYSYPGNIRELENIIERSVALAQTDEVQINHLPPSLTQNSIKVFRNRDGEIPTLEEREAEYIQYVVNECNHNRTKAAKLLGIDRVSLWRKMKKYGLVEKD